LAFVVRFILYLNILTKYKYHFYYDDFDFFSFGFEKKLGVSNFRLHLWLAKKLGIKILLFPSGCRSELTKEEFSRFDNGNVCDNCGWAVCDDRINKKRLSLVGKYADLVVGWGTFDSPHFEYTHNRYKSLDLDLWRPGLNVPKKYDLFPTENIRIMHSFYDGNRLHGGKNIKGSPYIVEAINRLKEEGYKVEYLYISNVPSNEIRYYQVQSDIVVEQLIYGWWGSTGVETLALGKPVVCYLRPAWKKFFLEKFPEYDELPIVEANTENIYEVLKNLVIDEAFRREKGKESRRFAESHYDVVKNTQSLIELVENI